MNKVTSIISIGIVVLASIAVVNYNSVDVEKINDDISTVPPSAGGLKTKDTTSTSISTDTSGLGGTTSGSSSGLKTTKIYKVTSADGVTSFSDVPRGVAKKSSTTTSTVASVTTTETTTTSSTPTTTTSSTPTTTTSSTPTTTTSSTPTTTTSSTPTTTTSSTPTTTTSSTPTTTTSSTSTTETVVAEVIEVVTTAPESTVSSPSISTSQTVKHSKWESQFAMLPQDDNGWSIITPASDSRFIYVSSSSGNDSNGKVYASSEIGDPKNPSINVAAFKTIEAALNRQRAGYSDWILLKKGDQWYQENSLYLASGRSSSEPLVFTSYGTFGDRPLINTGVQGGITLKGQNFVAITGIEFYANARDPESIDFAGWDSVGSPAGLTSIAFTGQVIQSITLEDNVFKFYSGGISFTGSEKQVDVVLRRNQILSSYATQGHSQGLFSYKGSMLIEENLFDHNGWYQQNFEAANTTSKGQATLFNHNLYLSSMSDTVITNNIMNDASSIGIKLTSDGERSNKTNYVKVKNIIIDNNLILKGEVGISAGGNTDFNNGFRWKNMAITNNVLLNIGIKQPTRRHLAWHMDANDWDGGNISGNYLLCNNEPEVTNVSGIAVAGLSNNISVKDNVVYGIRAADDRMVYLSSDSETKTAVQFENNFVSQNMDSCEKLVVSSSAIDRLISNARQQSSAYWNSEYTASRYNENIKAAFK